MREPVRAPAEDKIVPRAASSLIPAVNKLGTVPLPLAGSQQLKQRYLHVPGLGRGDGHHRPTRCSCSAVTATSAATRSSG